MSSFCYIQITKSAIIIYKCRISSTKVCIMNINYYFCCAY